MKTLRNYKGQMMPVKLNRHVNLLVLLMTLIAAGCTHNAKDAMTVAELSHEENNAYVDHYYQNYQPINKTEINKAAAAQKILFGSGYYLYILYQKLRMNVLIVKLIGI